MNVFLIPKITTHIKCDDIGIDKTDKTDNNIFISETLHCYLTTIKTQIDGYVEKWDTYKKYTDKHKWTRTAKNEGINKYSYQCKIIDR